MLFETLSIGDKTIKVCTCASINLCYWNIFHEDFMKSITAEDGTPTTAMMQMAFVMAKFGELGNRKAVNKLTVDDFGDWLDQFGNGELLTVLSQFEDLYMASNSSGASSKKNSVEPSEN